ncbi:MAG: hypothetical protein C0399_01155 [Syntrophus sp. (in: bacteria)]|nr:hypothetical protein [Syntrophus sp. (in: bacteria)]
MVKIIDCESPESTANSLSGLFGCSISDLAHQLADVNVERIYEEDNPDCPPDEFLFRRLVSAFGPPEKPEDTCWFHLTRTFSGNRFSEGILPLGMALDAIWETILRTFEQTEHFPRLQSMKSDGVEDYLYRLKVPNPFHWGPYAMLVRESAFHAHKIGNHDYLGLPEIIEDICNAYLHKFDLSIHTDVATALVPCIVKFITKSEDNFHGIGPAVYYYYKCIRKEPFSWNANTCYDAKGRSIPPESILKIEYLPEIHNEQMQPIARK